MKTRAIRARRRPRRGFSLTEIMVALAMLSLVLMSLARVTFTMASRGKENDTIAKRNAVLVQEANKFNALPYDSLATVSTATVTRTLGDFRFIRRVTITTGNSSEKKIKIVIVPFYAQTRKDSVFVTRTRPPGSPLCVGC